MKVIVCGAGRVGQQVVRRLAREGNEVTVIDNDPALITEITHALDVSGVTGFASYPSVMEAAGARDADMVIAATRSDEVNMMVCQVAYSHFSVSHKIARIRQRAYFESPWHSMFSSKHMPVDRLMFPERDVANAVIRWLETPATLGSVSFLDDAVRLVFVRLAENCPVLARPLNKLNQDFEGLSSIVVAVRRDGQIHIADAAWELAVGDEVHFVAPTDQVSRTLRLFGFDPEVMQRVVIIGGGTIGATIATSVGSVLQNPRICLIERDEGRAQEVERELSPGAVIRGDALDPDILAEARVAQADAVVAVTDNEQVNLLATAGAKELGARRGLALIGEPHLRRSARKLGVDATIDPEITTLSSLLTHVRPGFVRRIHASADGGSDVIEAGVASTSTLAGKILRETIPATCRVGAVLGADGTLREISGGLEFKVNDRVVLFAHTSDRRVVERLFQVDVRYF